MSAPFAAPPAPAPAPPSTAHPAPAPMGGADDRERLSRRDGWTADRQRRFLEAIAGGCTVSEACACVSLSPASAYALRRRAAGAAFRLGWDAACLLARDAIADTLLARAIDGQTDTYTRGDTVFTRHRYDNRLASTMLARLDRRADDAVGPVAQSARLVAQEFDAYLDLIDRDEGPARAGLFLGARAASDSAAWADIDPLLALARADRYMRSGAGMANEVAINDLDPAHREQWSAAQWARAEAAGLIVIADPDMNEDYDPIAEHRFDLDMPDDFDLDAVDLDGLGAMRRRSAVRKPSEADIALSVSKMLEGDDYESGKKRRGSASRAASAGEWRDDVPASQLSQLRDGDEDEDYRDGPEYYAVDDWRRYRDDLPRPAGSARGGGPADPDSAGTHKKAPDARAADARPSIRIP